MTACIWQAMTANDSLPMTQDMTADDSWWQLPYGRSAQQLITACPWQMIGQLWTACLWLVSLPVSVLMMSVHQWQLIWQLTNDSSWQLILQLVYDSWYYSLSMTDDDISISMTADMTYCIIQNSIQIKEINFETACKYCSIWQILKIFLTISKTHFSIVCT